MDGNVVRVLSRLRAIGADAATPPAVALHWQLAKALVDPARPGDFNQALMDLGATVCTPAAPACGDCPLRALCRAGAEERAAEQLAKAAFQQQLAVAAAAAPTAADNDAEAPRACAVCGPAAATPLSTLQAGLPVTRYPVKASKAAKSPSPTELHVMLLVYYTDAAGERHLLATQRPEGGLLGGLWQCPTVQHADPLPDVAAAQRAVLADAAVRPLLDACGIDSVAAWRRLGTFAHVFSHLRHEYTVVAARLPAAPAAPPPDARWLAASALGAEAVTTAMRKALKLLPGRDDDAAPPPAKVARPAKRAAAAATPAPDGKRQATLGKFFGKADAP